MRSMTALPAVVPFFWPIGHGDEPPRPRMLPGVVLGHDLGGWFVVDGSVRHIGTDRVVFVNTSLSLFEQTLVAFAAGYSRETTDSEAERLCRETRNRLQEADPAAIAPDAFWSAVMEEIESGVL
jgi:hypothetical protein